ncbi:MAG: glyceraldehyde-3-phosphate dehydrogenase, partial [Paracoccus sp. (in: a-proteobacteria)]|nr:glyceraldehyde-3-phosphate dehydrogenase [Paracoccus sp. (in: a-proteobacteria)]
MTRIALNGLGRIGKLVLRDLIDTGAGGQVVLLNDAVGSPEQHAMWLEFDSVHGRWPADIHAQDDGLTINGQTIAMTSARRIQDLPLAAMGIDVVIDCTGVFKTADKV